MNTGKWQIISGAFLLTLSCSQPTSAYETSTHALITANAVSRSQVANDTTILADLGLSAAQSTLATSVGVGVVAEDYVTDASVPGPQHVATVFNHFYDVQYNQYQGRGLQAYVVVRGQPSPDWALEDRGEVTAFGVGLAVGTWGPALVQYDGMPQNYSFRHAQQALFDALTGQDPAFRGQRTTAVFETLGHVVHHVQDMGQPQHTRNEAHKFAPNNYYEGYTEKRVNDSVPGILVANAYPIPQLGSARAYWYSVQSTTDRVPRYLGMAEFTSHNYISLDSGYTAALGSLQAIDPGHPLPNGTNADDGSAKTIERRSVSLKYADNSTATETAEFVVGHVVDALPGVPPKSRLLASSSVFDVPLRTFGNSRAFTVSEAVFNDNYTILLPRASAFSTGIINYFFRGRLDLRRNTSGAGWIVENRSAAGQTMTGQVSLYYETDSGLRYPISGGNTFNLTNLAPGAANTLAAAEPPSTARKLIAAFRGQIGSEGADINGGYYAVAGKVINYEPQTIPCGSSFSAQGSSEGKETFMELGSGAGKVEGEFEAYNIPDTMIVRRNNSGGAVLYNTNGQVPGFHEFSFQHPGGTDAAQNRIWIKVTGNTNTNTRWTSVISCPGRHISNSDRAQPRITITFGSTANGSGTGCPTGHFEFHLNDLFGPGTIYNVPWGNGQGWTSNPIVLTAGTNHWLKVVSVTDNHGYQGAQGCTPLTTPVMYKNFQSIDLSNFVNHGQAITIQ